jgi:hypothetical protein
MRYMRSRDMQVPCIFACSLNTPLRVAVNSLWKILIGSVVQVVVVAVLGHSCHGQRQARTPRLFRRDNNTLTPVIFTTKYNSARTSAGASRFERRYSNTMAEPSWRRHARTRLDPASHVCVKHCIGPTRAWRTQDLRTFNSAYLRRVLPIRSH